MKIEKIKVLYVDDLEQGLNDIADANMIIVEVFSVDEDFGQTVIKGHTNPIVVEENADVAEVISKDLGLKNINLKTISSIYGSNGLEFEIHLYKLTV